MLHVRTAALLVALSMLVPTGAGASGGLFVDAGVTQKVEVGAPFTLMASVEDTAGPVSFAWSAPAGCSVLSPASQATDAVCEEHGTHTFTVTAGDGTGVDSSEVRIVAILEEVVHERLEGEVLVGLPDEIYPGSGQIDGGTDERHFEVPSHGVLLRAELDWDLDVNDLDFVLHAPEEPFASGGHGRSYLTKPEVVEIDDPAPGTWTAVIEPKVSTPERWTLDLTTTRRFGDASVPTVIVPATVADPGETVTLAAQVGGGTEPYTIGWETDLASNRFDDGSGDTFTFVFQAVTSLKVRVTDAAGLTATAAAFVHRRSVNEPRPYTVVAVVDDAFTPYHVDFLGSHHPWNTDGDPTNDFDFTVDPATYIDGYPGAAPVEVTLPESPFETVSDRATGIDAEAFASMERSTLADPKMYWFPGTKIVGALRFGGGSWAGTNSSHGTRSAASAAGNISGTCPECLVVLVGGIGDGLAWAAGQDWIDVVTNSYGRNTTLVLRDNIYFGSPLEATRAAADAGQTIVFSGGNGLANAYDVPQFTYWSSEKGPDWVVTVGAVAPSTKQTYLGHGKPVDVSSVGSSYPSTGGTRADGRGTHSGTSNAAPVVAGTFAKTIQVAREAFGDLSSRKSGGVVTSGPPVACGAENPACVLGDGALTIRELRETVLRTTEPSPAQVAVQTIPTTEHAYYYQGHGVLAGRMDGAAAYEAEWRRIAGVLTGARTRAQRTEVEERWFVVDSFCRQRLWGAWTGGRFRGMLPVLDPGVDPFAYPFRTWCEPLPERAFARVGDL